MESWVTIILLSISGLLLGLFVRSLKTPFFLLAERSAELFDIILSKPSSETQIIILNIATKKVIISLAISGTLCCSVFLIYFHLIKFILDFNNSALISLKFGLFISTFISFFTLVLVRRKKERYSDLNKLFHRLILNNYHLGRSLLGWQVRNFDDSFLDGRVIGVIVTGLARSGTTALTMALERSKNFRSLDYSNMPFVLAPRFWRKYYNPSKSAEVSERSHGDGIDIGFNEVEALEEVFFINLLNGNYIKEFYLDSHLIPPAVNSLYRKYIKSIANGKLYLAKNNNFALRGESFLKQNSDIKVVVLFRDPLEQSNSLMEQHKRFIKLQTDDDFVLEYMNFIGHHEFGKGMKPFILGAFNGSSSYSTNSINFWLEIWLNYYSNILKLDGVLLVCYEDYCRNPNEALDGISAFIGITLDFQEERPFELKKSDSSDIDINLALKASELYSELLRIPSKYS